MGLGVDVYMGNNVKGIKERVQQAGHIPQCGGRSCLVIDPEGRRRRVLRSGQVQCQLPQSQSARQWGYGSGAQRRGGNRRRSLAQGGQLMPRGQRRWPR